MEEEKKQFKPDDVAPADAAQPAGAGAQAAGAGAQYATPFAFGRSTKNRATKTLMKQGYKKIKRPKRPSHTKGFDYL